MPEELESEQLIKAVRSRERFLEGILGGLEGFVTVDRDWRYTFVNDAAAMMVLSDAIHVMLLKHDFYSTFTSKPIADAHRSSQVLLAISADSAADVDALVETAGSAGGVKDPGPRQDMGGMMYERSFEDPDGHHWEAVWMDPKAAEQGASAFQEA